MGSIVMKEAPDVDFYIEWSSVVEAPTFAGTRAEMLAHLQRSSDSWLRDDAPHHPERRLERADKTGTSSLWVEKAGMRDRYAEEGAWDDDGEIYEQKGTVKRANLFVLTRRLQENDNADLSDLIEPFEDAAGSVGAGEDGTVTPRREQRERRIPARRVRRPDRAGTTRE